jgi:hypothetical protein
MGNDAEKAFDFDYWSQLWKRDPEAFEAERARLMERFVASAPEEKRQRLSAIQWRVDMARKQAKTPMAACLRIQQMMWESLLGKHGLLKALESLRGTQVLDPRERRQASVVSFDRSKTDLQES